MADFNNMNIHHVQPMKPLETSAAKLDKSDGVDFKEILQNSINQINDMNDKADQAIEKLATGEIQDMHQVMIAIEKADLTFKTMMQIRNKLLDAYQEVMKMRF